tara:strand:- start:317 stop:712 length:396 start_codon:yes stop_codon:yes gene_type:complete
MKLIKTMVVMLMVGGSVFAQNISPVITMTWDWNSDSTEYVIGQRIGVQATDGDKYYGIDTDGADHRTFFGWKMARLGLGITADAADAAENVNYFTAGASYNVTGGLRTEIEYVTVPDNETSYIRIGLSATF